MRPVELTRHARDADMVASLARPRGRSGAAQAVDELQQLTGVLHAHILDAKAAMFARSPHCVPCHQAASATGVIIARPDEVAAPLIELRDHSSGERDGVDQVGQLAIEHDVDQHRAPHGIQQRGLPVGQVAIRLVDVGVEGTDHRG